ncbi:MAG: M48 family metallopeptidase [Treponema sp.]|jgi:predicted Zn-dependent protease|nr:M48 family metallopeptidase [Treponema sp.]
MNKKLIGVLLLVLAGTVTFTTAQDLNFADALSRLERTINQAEEEFTLQDSYFLGRTTAAFILNRYPLFTENQGLIVYLNLICNALAINSRAPNWYNGYQVMILDDLSINAFSTPGGHIFITRGLIELSSSEDMLAAIIAHELAHIQLNHGTSDIMQNRIIANFAQERQRISHNLARETRQEMFSLSINEMIQKLFSGGYSQLQEFEADLWAFNLLASTGYNPASLLELLRILERIQGNQITSLNASHPLPTQRIANLERNIPSFRRFADNSSFRTDRFKIIMER